jgi:hypothetical protein
MPRRPVSPLAAAQQRLRQSADELVAAAQDAALNISGGLAVAPAVNRHTERQTAAPRASVAGSSGAAASGGSAPDRMVVVCGTSVGWVSAKLGDIPVAAYAMVEDIHDHRAHCPPGRLPYSQL